MRLELGSCIHPEELGLAGNCSSAAWPTAAVMSRRWHNG